MRLKDKQRQKKHRQQSSISRLAEEVSQGVANSYLGKMSHSCQHCGALHFKYEVVSGKNEYRQCCHYGSVALPALSEFPEELTILLQETNTEGKKFRENIRSYSNAVSFASMGASIASPPGNGPFCFRTHGQIYHRIGPLHAEAGKNAQYAQLYILDSAQALQKRMGNAGNSRCDESLMKKLGDLINKISPFAAAFKMMHEVEQEEIRRSEKEKRGSHSIRMTFYINNRVRDQRRYNLPRANEIAAVFVGENGEVPTYRQIAVHPRGQNLQTISV